LFGIAEPFGRVWGKHFITAGNVAKYEALHAVIILDEPDPPSFTREQDAHYLDTGSRWVKGAYI